MIYNWHLASLYSLLYWSKTLFQQARGNLLTCWGCCFFMIFSVIIFGSNIFIRSLISSSLFSVLIDSINPTSVIKLMTLFVDQTYWKGLIFQLVWPQSLEPRLLIMQTVKMPGSCKTWVDLAVKSLCSFALIVQLAFNLKWFLWPELPTTQVSEVALHYPEAQKPG